MKEIRNNGNIEGFNEENRTVSGYAVKFDSESQDMGFIEVIKRGAITEETIKQSDVFAKMNHRDDVILARSRYGEGSLKLELREDGLFYSFECPKTESGNELLEHIRRKEINTSSFCFSLSGVDSEKWYKDGDTLRRDILKIDRLYDVSPVFEPAYLETTCNNRCQDMMKTSKEIDEMMNAKMNEVLEYAI